MSERVLLRNGRKQLAEEFFLDICAIHDEVFSQPPFVWAPQMSQGNADEIGRLMDDPTFGLVTAEQDTELAGYAFGHRLPVDHGWWNDFLNPLPDDFTAEWEGRTFALISLAVRAPLRRTGIGGRILHELLRERGEERAILSVQPTADETQSFYRHMGWRKVGRKGPLAGVTPPYWDIYARATRGDPGADGEA